MRNEFQGLYALVPETGQISYEDLYQKANASQIQYFHDMRRLGVLDVELTRNSDGKLITMVSRGGNNAD